MKKTAGLVALSFTVAAAGCALVPQQALKSLGSGSQLSGPVTFQIPVPAQARTTQVVNSTIRQCEVVVYTATGTWTTAKGAGTTNPYLSRGTIAKNPLNGQPLVATTSVTPGTMTTISVPALPTGTFVVVANLYTDNANHFSATTGLPTADAPKNTAAQAEATVTAVAAQPVTTTFTMYNTIAYASNLDTTTYTRNATNSTTITSVSLDALYNALSTDNLNIRMANFNGYTQIASDSQAPAHHVIRVMLVPNVDFLDTAASDDICAAGVSGAGYAMYDVNSTAGDPATVSLPTWHWATDAGSAITATYSYMYTDIDLGAGATVKTLYHSTGSWLNALRTGSFSLVLPRTLVNNNGGASCSVMLIDLASASSLPSNASF